MAICETCGGKYTPTAESPDCPRCAVKRRPARAASPGSGAVKARTPASRPPSSASVAAAPGAARPRRAVAASPEPEPEEEPRQIHHPEPQGVLDQNAKLGLMVAGGLAIVVLGVVVVVVRKHAEERRATEAYQSFVKNLYTELTALNLDDEAQAKQLIAKAKDSEKRWQNSDVAPKIQTLVARAGASLETGKERRETLGAFTEIENLLKDTSALSPESINDLRRRLTELEAKISLGGEEFLKRYTDARTTADKAFVTRKLDAARENAGTPRTALVDSQAAEDEIRKVLDQAILEKNKDLTDFYSDLYKKAITQTDQLATALFTDKVIAELPWTDCLAGEQLKYWTNNNSKGFSRDPQPGSLRVVGPDADANKQAVFSIGDREQWRNFVLEMEFVIEKGNVEMFLRLGRSANANTISYPMSTDGEQRSLKAGKPYHVIMKVLGSQWAIRYENDDDLDTPPPKEETITWAKTRKGAIGFLVPPGARFRVTTFKVRELR